MRGWGGGGLARSIVLPCFLPSLNWMRVPLPWPFLFCFVLIIVKPLSVSHCIGSSSVLGRTQKPVLVYVAFALSMATCFSGISYILFSSPYLFLHDSHYSRSLFNDLLRSLKRNQIKALTRLR